MLLKRMHNIQLLRSTNCRVVGYKNENHLGFKLSFEWSKEEVSKLS